MTTNFEPHECVIFVKSTKIGTHENRAIHSMYGLGQPCLGPDDNIWVIRVNDVKKLCFLVLNTLEIYI